MFGTTTNRRVSDLSITNLIICFETGNTLYFAAGAQTKAMLINAKHS